MTETAQYPQKILLEEAYHSDRPIDLSKTTREDIKNYFINTYAMYETLFTCINSEESWKINPDPLRRPILWYLGHTAALYINKFKDAKLSEPINEWFEKFFKTGVDPIYAHELDNDVYKQKLPHSQEVWKFRKQVFDRVLKVIDEMELNLPIQENDPAYCVLLCCEHERIHYETSTVLLRQMPLNSIVRPKGWKYAEYSTKDFPSNEMLFVKGQDVQVGKPRDFPTYGWDNEYGKLTLSVHDFYASKYLISNGEYLEFYNSGAYNQQKYWTEEGWEWKQRENIQKPLFWVQEGQTMKYRAIFDVIEMPMNWPVDVNFHEAKAYANWKGPEFRLIKEGEFHLIRAEHKLENYQKKIVEADIGGFDKEAGNVNIKFGSSCPVDSQRPSPLGFYDTYGNVWQWSETYFRPYPGFREHDLYPDYSGGCFDQKHSMIYGGAWSSTGLSASSFFRIGFRRHFYQNSGFRLVKEIKDEDQQEMYTDKVYLNRYLHFNFASNEDFFTAQSQTFDLMKNYESYPVKIADECIRFYEKVRKELSPDQQDIYKDTHALDLGCGMGRTAFELARKFPKVTGLDYAHGFIDVANELKQKGEMPYKFKRSGDLETDFVAKIADDIDRSKVHFIQGDAMNLPNQFGPFDLIIASNLIDRLYNPQQCLVDLCPHLTYNGLLIITSPYTWMENVASKDRWVGGKDGQTTFEALKELMGTLCFELVDEQTMTLLIKEHDRKFEFIMPHMTIWRKKQFSQEFATSIFKQAKKY